MRPARRSTSRPRGAAAVETALVLPILLLLLMGLWEVGTLVASQQLVQNAAREAGRQASTGRKTSVEVKADAIKYLSHAGVKTTGVQVVLTNLTGSPNTDPTEADQLDRYRIEVELPFDNVRWILLDKITNATSITARSEWYSMKDLPVVVDGTMPR